MVTCAHSTALLASKAARKTFAMLGDLVEGIVLHAFEGRRPFGEESLARIQDLKRIYGMKLEAKDAHRLHEAPKG